MGKKVNQECLDKSRKKKAHSNSTFSIQSTYFNGFMSCFIYVTLKYIFLDKAISWFKRIVEKLRRLYSNLNRNRKTHGIGAINCLATSRFEPKQVHKNGIACCSIFLSDSFLEVGGLNRFLKCCLKVEVFYLANYLRTSVYLYGCNCSWARCKTFKLSWCRSAVCCNQCDNFFLWNQERMSINDVCDIHGFVKDKTVSNDSSKDHNWPQESLVSWLEGKGLISG